MWEFKLRLEDLNVEKTGSGADHRKEMSRRRGSGSEEPGLLQGAEEVNEEPTTETGLCGD